MICLLWDLSWGAMIDADVLADDVGLLGERAENDIRNVE